MIPYQYISAGTLHSRVPVFGRREATSLLFYAAETTLQLYMVESSEQIRDLYAAAYSMPESSALIMRNIAGKLAQLDSGMDTTGN